MKRRILLFALVFACVIPASGAGRVFRAGADRTDITPELGILIVGNFNPQPATHVHDPLFVRSLVLDDGATQIAFAVVDNVGVPRVVCDEAKRLIAEFTPLPRSHVLISATHTHSGGTARERVGSDEEIRDGFTGPVLQLAPYQQFLARRIADSVRNALQRLEPARIGWGSGGEPGQVFNRRWHVRSEASRRNPFGGVDTVRMNPRPASPDDLIKAAGPTDAEIAFLSVQSPGGRPIAVLANYSLHYVGGVPPGAISGDYFGVFDHRLAEMLDGEKADPPFVGIMSNGTSGDINNINVLNRGTPMAPYEKMRRVANAVAAEVYRAYQTTLHHEWVKLDARYDELALEPRRPTAGMIDYAKRKLAEPAGGTPWHANEKTYARSVLTALNAPAVLQFPLQVFRIGEVCIAAVPAETFAEAGLEIKGRSPFAQAFTISHANGAYGYLPTVGQHRLGGYETWLGTNRVEIGASPKIVTRLIEMMQEMR